MCNKDFTLCLLTRKIAGKKGGLVQQELLNRLTWYWLSQKSGLHCLETNDGSDDYIISPFAYTKIAYCVMTFFLLLFLIS